MKQKLISSDTVCKDHILRNICLDYRLDILFAETFKFKYEFTKEIKGKMTLKQIFVV